MTQTIDIYYQGYHIDTKTFDEYFAIGHDSDSIVWFTERDGSRGAAEVWIRTGKGHTTIKSMLSSWKLIIDTIETEKYGYSNLIVTGRTVEFINADYRFVGKFRGQPLGTVADVVNQRVIEWLIEEDRKKAKEPEQE